MTEIPEETPKAPRRFTVRAVETSVRSIRRPSVKPLASDDTKKYRLLYSGFQGPGRKNGGKEDGRDANRKQDVVRELSDCRKVDQGASDQMRKPRRFVPQLVETTRRSSRDTTPSMRATDETDLLPGDWVFLPRHLRTSDTTHVPDSCRSIGHESRSRLLDSRFSSTALRRQVPRQPSYRLPPLEPIRSQPESEESSDSNCPSLSTSPSAASEDIHSYKNGTRLRESCDDRFSRYLLALAAQAAEKQMAMAIYPNDIAHEAVDHFAIDRDSDTSDEDIHGEKQMVPSGKGIMTEGYDLLGKGLGARKYTPSKQISKSLVSLEPGHTPRGSRIDPFRSIVSVVADNFVDHHSSVIAIGLDSMHISAKPPMLGQNIIFPRTVSPQQTRFDVTQRPCARADMNLAPREATGLWNGPSTCSRDASDVGLWRGVCSTAEQDNHYISKSCQMGIMTPTTEPEDMLINMSDANRHQLPRSPASSGGYGVLGIDDVLCVELEIEKEVQDCFVTQIYNYLSLGFPALAREFDFELSKISRMSVEDIRRYDEWKNTKGYVGTPEGDGPLESEVKDSRFGRWVALRLYIREWARQQPRMGGFEAKNWGDTARRGSWAI